METVQKDPKGPQTVCENWRYGVNQHKIILKVTKIILNLSKMISVEMLRPYFERKYKNQMSKL